MTSTGGSAANSGTGSSTMIWVIPEATEVKQGEVIARLDASTYEEMLRQQTIVVEQAKASHLQAQLDLEIAKIALREYLEGTVKETIQEMEANLSLAKSNVTHGHPAAQWTRKMNDKGYASVAQIKTDEQTWMSAELALQSQEMTYDLFKQFTLPKNQKTLQADITTAQTTLDSEQVKLNHSSSASSLAQAAGRSLHDPGPARGRRLLLLRPQSAAASRPAAGRDRGGNVGPPGTEALLPPRPERDGGPGRPERVDRQPGRHRASTGTVDVRGASRRDADSGSSCRSARSPTR